MERIYAAIDLKSFYASVECVERGYDPLHTALVVADGTRTDKTICLAVSPGLKEFGVPGRPRLFEVRQIVRQENRRREALNRQGCIACSFDSRLLRSDTRYAVGFLTAVPRMALYLEYSRRIYEIYLEYFSADDIHIYSVDEVFIDLTGYIHTYNLSAEALVRHVIGDIMRRTGITATAGLGSNLYLSKVAMDIMAKKMTPDKDGVRMAWLDEQLYRKQLWDHRPITDFWRIGHGYARTLAKHGIETMGDVALCSLGRPKEYHNAELLYRLFGVNAELLIDHAWGIEPCTMQDIKEYQPASHSLSSGQVLGEPYSWEKARIVIREMADLLVLEMVEKGLCAGQVGVSVRYDVSNMEETADGKRYAGVCQADRYGRRMPQRAYGTENLFRMTASAHDIIEAAIRVFDRITRKELYIRKLSLEFHHVGRIEQAGRKADVGLRGAGKGECVPEGQLSLFDMDQPSRADPAPTVPQSADPHQSCGRKEDGGEWNDDRYDRERRLQEALLAIRRKYGKNAVFRAMSLQEGATARTRNRQIGGHRA